MPESVLTEPISIEKEFVESASWHTREKIL